MFTGSISNSVPMLSINASCYHLTTLSFFSIAHSPGRVVQSVTCLATDVSLIADPGVTSSIPARSYTFVEIDHQVEERFLFIDIL